MAATVKTNDASRATACGEIAEVAPVCANVKHILPGEVGQRDALQLFDEDSLYVFKVAGVEYLIDGYPLRTLLGRRVFPFTRPATSFFLLARIAFHHFELRFRAALLVFLGPTSRVTDLGNQGEPC